MEPSKWVRIGAADLWRVLHSDRLAAVAKRGLETSGYVPRDLDELVAEMVR